jgi:hypothetical protein
VAYQLGFKRQPREILLVQSWHKKIGYMPYYGPDIAAFNPTQQAAFNSNIGAAEAFGMVPQGSLTAMQGMAPEATTYAGGLQAYSSGNLFDQALAELESRRPGQFAQYNKMFVNPFTGEAANAGSCPNSTGSEDGYAFVEKSSNSASTGF